MSVVYMDRNGNIKFSRYCSEPKIPKNKRGVCGAITRRNTICQAPPVWNKSHDKPRNGRCKLHGGLSTGPRTGVGREAIKLSNKNRAKK